jgi:hypothetical protein
LKLRSALVRLSVPAVPFAVSAALSLATVGDSVHWQDSGLFLSGVKELSVLHPPGFVLYQVLCRAWTLALGFLDFTLAAHLFSAFCAAAAAGAIALAARDLLRQRGRSGDLEAIAAGCLAAAGFTFWSAALLAKGYALLYLVLSLLLWRMIRADETRSPRDFTGIAALIGLAWAAHPSSTLLAPAFLLFVFAHRKAVGSKGLAWRTALAAACALGPSLLLPILAFRLHPGSFGHPASLGEWIRFVRGGRFTDLSGAFGWEGFRATNTLLFAWEDFLGVGTALAVAGLVAAGRRGRLFAASWTLPFALVTLLFRIEGQQDLWLAAAWLPLHVSVALGLALIPSRAAKVGLPLAGLVWALAANVPDVSLRSYDLAERFGRFHLEPLERDALLVLESDDALGTVRWLQDVRGVRTDVLVLSATRFDPSRWYERALRSRDPGLVPGETPDLAGFVRANEAKRPTYFEALPSLPGTFVPAGPLVRVLRPGEPEAPIPWPAPDPGEAAARRRRGIRIDSRPGGFEVRPEAYETRWPAALSRARLREGTFYFRKADPRAAAALEAALALDPEPDRSPALFPLGATYAAQGRAEQAEPLLKRALTQELAPRNRVHALSTLSRLAAAKGRVEEARAYRAQAMDVVGSDPELRREFERFSERRP